MPIMTIIAVSMRVTGGYRSENFIGVILSVPLAVTGLFPGCLFCCRYDLAVSELCLSGQDDQFIAFKSACYLDVLIDSRSDFHAFGVDALLVGVVDVYLRCPLRVAYN